MKIIDGKKIAEEILNGLKKEIEAKKIRPALAVVSIGDNPASQLYIQLKEKAARKIGIRVKNFNFSSQILEKDVLETINSLNQDPKINGILVQMPLPQGMLADKIVEAINSQKDVDGFIKESQFKSPFILSIWQALEATGEDLKSKKIIALVNSDIFGKNLCSFLGTKSLKADYLLADRDNLERKINQADVLITALGRPNFIKGSMVKEEVTLIDGGISKIDGEIIGDVDSQSVSQKAKWLAPVPGGLGSMTVAFLLKNVVAAATLKHVP